ncbi:MAG: SulP family inorganic anion transporter [bacterium]
MKSKLIERIFPFLRWLPVSRKTLKADIIAGVTVAMLLIPQAMAYAQLAGLPPHYGLYAAFLPVLAGALFGWCHQLQTGPVAMTSLLTAAVLAPFAVARSDHFIELAVILCLMTGVIRLMLGVCRMSFIVDFLSHSVIVGFTNAAAIIIALSQLGQFMGVHSDHSGSFLYDVWNVISNSDSANTATLLFGVSALAVMLCLTKWLPRLPGIMIAVVITTAASWAWTMFFPGGHEYQIVGVIPAGLPHLILPSLNLQTILELLPAAFLIVLIGFAEVAAITRSLALRTGQRLDFNQELIGQGMAGIVGGLTQSYPVSGSFSRSALNYSAGGITGFSSVVTAVAVLLLLLVFSPLLYHLPHSVLAAAIIASVTGLIDFGAMRRAWLAGRDDGIIALTTFAACILFAPDLIRGLFFGAVLAIVLHIYRDMKPRVAILARHEDGTLRDAERHSLTPDSNVLSIRFERSLTFINASHFSEMIVAAVREYPEARHLLIVGDSINELDASGAEAVRSIHDLLREQGVSMDFSGLKWPVMEVLTRTGIVARIGSNHFFRTADAALKAIPTMAGNTRT